MTLQRFCMAMLTAAALAATAAMAQTATTTSTVTREASYPPTGLASSETAQINVTNLATASSNGTAASCTGSISFLNSSGTIIGTATSFTVTSGQTFSASLPFSKTGASGIRTEIRGTLSLTSTSDVPCNLSSSLETYDSTAGTTHIYLSNGADLGAGNGPGYGGPGGGGH